MALKPGYKNTEAGLVPIDWLDHMVGDLIEFEGGSQPDKSVFNSSQKPGYVRLIQIRDYKSDRFETYIPRHLARRFCSADDIMIGRYGPPIFQVLRGLAGAYNVALIKALPQPEITRHYAYYFLKQDKLFAFIERLSQRSSGQTGVDLKELRAYPLPLPPTRAEQEAITEALSDADALIESLEQLLAKKRHVKQGAMQELLTGKRRLPGYAITPDYKQTEVGVIPEDWACSTIGSFIDLLTGFPFPSSGYSQAGIRLLRGSNVKRGCTDWSDDLTAYWPTVTADIRQYSLRAGDIVVAMDGSLVGRSFASLDGADVPALLLQRVARIRTDVVAQTYLKAWICNQRFTEHCDTVKTTTAIPHISPADIRSFKIAIPPTKGEQETIAAILSDMDAEIAALEAKLAKTRQIKQGMMQELLTGRIRLV